MKFSQLKFLCDENISDEIGDFLNSLSIDTVSVKQLKLVGKSDDIILAKAFKEKRVVITQDNDFGKIVFTEDVSFIGIIYLRPGHFSGPYALSTIKTLQKNNLDYKPPFILVADQKQDNIKIRLRNNL